MISRADAQANNLPRYFTGVICKHGHVAERYVASKTCVECANVAANKTKDKNPRKYLALVKKWQQANQNKTAEYQRTYRLRNVGQRNLWTMNYKAAKAERMPTWLNDAEIFEMECVYKYCAGLRNVGLDYHVDHVVPLRGDNVSGLHVSWNLQVIPGHENMSKGNTFNG